MSAHRTAEEVKQHHIEVMGDDLGSLYHALWNELAWLYSKWEEYVELFGTKPSRVDLINKKANQRVGSSIFKFEIRRRDPFDLVAG